MSSAVSASGETGEVVGKEATKNSFGESRWFKAVTIASGGLSGGISSSICGGSFATGFMQGVIVAGMNHLAHWAVKGEEDGPPGKRRKIVKKQSALHNWASNLDAVSEMTAKWLFGIGTSNYDFGEGSFTEALSDAYRVNLARDAWYIKAANTKNMKVSLTNWKGSFGISGLIRAGFDPVEQFVGSFRLDIFSDGKYLTFKLSNTTSFESFLYGIGPNWGRSTFSPMSNVKQTYVWKELIQK